MCGSATVGSTVVVWMSFGSYVAQGGNRAPSLTRNYCIYRLRVCEGSMFVRDQPHRTFRLFLSLAFDVRVDMCSASTPKYTFYYKQTQAGWSKQPMIQFKFGSKPFPCRKRFRQIGDRQIPCSLPSLNLNKEWKKNGTRRSRRNEKSKKKKKNY